MPLNLSLYPEGVCFAGIVETTCYGEKVPLTLAWR